MRSGLASRRALRLEALGRRSERIKRARYIGRERVFSGAHRLVLVEGVRALRTAAMMGAEIEEVFVSDEEALSGLEFLWRDSQTLANVSVWLVGQASLRSIATTVTPQPVVGVARARTLEPSEMPAAEGPALYLAGVSDPGNAGAIVRTAVGMLGKGARVVVGPSSVDVFAPKAVRASAGAIFGAQVYLATSNAALAEIVRKGNVLVGTDPVGGEPVAGFAWPPRAVLVLGSEASGTPPEVERYVSTSVSIPLEGGLESYNVAVAAGMLLFDWRAKAGWASPSLPASGAGTFMARGKGRGRARDA